MTPRLSRDFYARSVLTVARDCIGKILVHELSDTLLAGRIVESEAYQGPRDRAAHSYDGRRTARTEAMFGPAGHAYIFMLYGLHYNFNLVTGQLEQPEAVLVRALEPISGQQAMALNRGVDPASLRLTNGPGKLCQALGINRVQYGADLTRGPLYLKEGKSGKVVRSARIGIDYAGAWAKKPWRFYEASNPFVSRPRG